MAPCSRFCDSVVARSLREGEEPEERRRKKIIIPLYLALGTMLLPFACWKSAEMLWYSFSDHVTARTWREEASEQSQVSYMVWVAAMVAMVVQYYGLVTYALCTHRLSLFLCEALMVLSTFFLVVMDFHWSTTHRTTILSIIIVVLDLLLIVDARPQVGSGVCAAACIWPIWKSFFLRPAGVTALESLGFWLGFYVSIFTTDFYITRGFATSLRAEQRVIKATVETSEVLAEHLAAYRLEDALRLVDSAATLPPRLSAAFRGLVANLNVYRPYIPQSCLPHYCSAEQADMLRGSVKATGDEDEEEPMSPLCIMAADQAPDSPEADYSQGTIQRGATVAVPAYVTAWRDIESDRAATGSLRRSPTMAVEPHRSAFESIGREQTGATCATCATGATAAGPAAGRLAPAGPREGPRHSRDSAKRRTSPAMWRVVQTAARDVATPPRVETVSVLESILRSPRSEGVDAPRSPKAAASFKMLGRLSQRRVTLIAGNLRGYLLVVRGATSAQLDMLHAQLLAQMVERTTARGGLSDSISSDRFYASLNGAKAKTGHRLAGVRLAWDLAGDGYGCVSLAGLLPAAAPVPSPRRCDTDRPLRSPRRGDAPDPGGGECAVAAGVCAGDLLCGDVGCAGLLRYSFVGVAAAWVHSAERLATRWRCAAVANEKAAADAETAFLLRLRAAAVMAKRSHAGQRAQEAWQVVAPRVQQNPDEWMYELERQASQDPWQHLNAARRALYAADYDRALRVVEEGRAARAPPPLAAELRAAYDELAAEAGRRPHPPHAVLHDAHLLPAAAADPPARGAAAWGGAQPHPPTSRQPHRDQLMLQLSGSYHLSASQLPPVQPSPRQPTGGCHRVSRLSNSAQLSPALTM